LGDKRKGKEGQVGRVDKEEKEPPLSRALPDNKKKGEKVISAWSKGGRGEKRGDVLPLSSLHVLKRGKKGKKKEKVRIVKSKKKKRVPVTSEIVPRWKA